MGFLGNLRSGRQDGDGGGLDGFATDWESLLLVFLHDPVDKALDVRGHVRRAARYASAALGREVSTAEIKRAAGRADVLAAVAERVPMPTAGIDGERAVGPDQGVLHLRHPLSGDGSPLHCSAIDEGYVSGQISGIVDGLESPKQRFLALWRLLPERLKPWYRDLPADTRIPDHTLIHHADITAGIWTSAQQVDDQGALLSVVVGPVQSFIDAARSVRDLWTGSAILSWLTFQAMLPVIDLLGPTALVYPSLRANPLMDLWLRNSAGMDCIPLPDASTRKAPSLPHRFVAIIPWGEKGSIAGALSDKCKQAFRNAWNRVAAGVRAELSEKLNGLYELWDRNWVAQNAEFFSVTASAVPMDGLDDHQLGEYLGGGSFEKVWKDAAAIRKLAIAIPDVHRPGYSQDAAGRWQARLEYSARIMGATRQIRHVPSNTGWEGSDESVPIKCSLFGSWEQMGPANLEQSRHFWERAENALIVNGVRLRKGERFCAVALTKRFAGPVLLAKELDLDPSNLRFSDTATVAAESWLRAAEIDADEARKLHGSWSGQWLHAVTADEAPAPREIADRIKRAIKNHGKPPTYYAILKLDGDDIGGWLRGSNSPALREVLHPRFVKYFEGLGSEDAYKALDAKRPVGPALHASISDALGRFASQHAPKIVRDHLGTIIYCGGDDLLALLPARDAVTCASSLYQAFQYGSPGMGSKATVSAGIAFAHYREDLRLAIQAARAAEQQAKSDGKNLLHIYFMRRSGEHAGATVPWPAVSWFQELVGHFAAGASSRWVYKFAEELRTLSTAEIPSSAIKAQMIRIGNRIEDPEWSKIAEPDQPGILIARWWDEFVAATASSSAQIENVLSEFVRLCGGAAFVARAQD